MDRWTDGHGLESRQAVPESKHCFSPMAIYFMPGSRRHTKVDQSNTTRKISGTGGARCSHLEEASCKRSHKTNTRGDKA